MLLAPFIPAERPTTRLSHVPSGLIRQAVADVRWALGQPHVRFQMDEWVFPQPIDGGSMCDICVAGAVLLRRFVQPTDASAHPSMEQYSIYVQDAMWALDDLRKGNILKFLRAILSVDKPLALVSAQALRLADDPARPQLLELHDSPDDTDMLAWCDQADKLADWLEQHSA